MTLPGRFPLAFWASGTYQILAGCLGTMARTIGRFWTKFNIIQIQYFTPANLLGLAIRPAKDPPSPSTFADFGGVGVVPRSKNATFGMNSNFGIEIASPASRLV